MGSSFSPELPPAQAKGSIPEANMPGHNCQKSIVYTLTMLFNFTFPHMK